MRRRHWIEFAESRIALDRECVLVGRNPDCNVVLADASISRHHALFRVADEGIEVVPLGARPVLVNGVPHDAPSALEDGGKVEIEGHLFVARITGTRELPEVHWFVERRGGALVRISEARATLGGGDEDDIVLASWPAGAVVLAVVGPHLVLESCAQGVSAGRALEPGAMINVATGERIAFGAEAVRMVALPADPSKPTLRRAADEVAQEAVLTCMPRGGRLALRVANRERVVFLAGKRCDLVACLLRPPAPYAPGESIPDAVLAERVWPGTFSGRTDINTLLWRIRKDFSDAGLGSVSFFDRQGGGVRARVADGGRLEVRGLSPAGP